MVVDRHQVSLSNKLKYQGVTQDRTFTLKPHPYRGRLRKDGQGGDGSGLAYTQHGEAKHIKTAATWHGH